MEKEKKMRGIDVTVSWATPENKEKCFETKTMKVLASYDESKHTYVPDPDDLYNKAKELGLEGAYPINKCYNANLNYRANAQRIFGSDGKPLFRTESKFDENNQIVVDKNGNPVTQSVPVRLDLPAYVISCTEYAGEMNVPNWKDVVKNAALDGDGKKIRQLYRENQSKLGATLSIIENKKVYMDYTDEKGVFHPVANLFSLQKLASDNFNSYARRRELDAKYSRYEAFRNDLNLFDKKGNVRKVGYFSVFPEENIMDGAKPENCPTQCMAILASAVLKGRTAEELLATAPPVPTVDKMSAGYNVPRSRNYLEMLVYEPGSFDERVHTLESRAVKLDFMFPKTVQQRDTEKMTKAGYAFVNLSRTSEPIVDAKGNKIPNIPHLEDYGGNFNEEAKDYIKNITGKYNGAEILCDVYNGARAANANGKDIKTIVLVGYNKQKELVSYCNNYMDNESPTLDDIRGARGRNAIISCSRQMTMDEAEACIGDMIRKKYTSIILPQTDENENLINAAIDAKAKNPALNVIVQGLASSDQSNRPGFYEKMASAGVVCNFASSFRTNDSERIMRKNTLSGHDGMTDLYDARGDFASDLKVAGVSDISVMKFKEDEYVAAEPVVENEKGQEDMQKASEIANTILSRQEQDGVEIRNEDFVNEEPVHEEMEMDLQL